MFKNGDWEIGDIVKVKSTNQNIMVEFGEKSYEVFRPPTTNLEDDVLLMLKDIKNGEWENYYRFPLELDVNYYRRKKLDKILDNIDSFNIMERAKASAEMNREQERLILMKMRKEKLLNIQSNIFSLYLKNLSEEMSVLSRRAEYSLTMERRKRKLKKICSKLETR